MKTAVIYYSETGNTAKVGGAIATAIEDTFFLGPLQDAPPLDDDDLVFVGMPIVQFGPPEPVKRFVAEKCAGRRVALFVTHAAPRELDLLQPWLEACTAIAADAELVGLFNCQGQLAEPVRQAMLESGSPMLVQFAQMSDCAAGEPGEAALLEAADFARDVVGRVGAVAVERAASVTA
jgi:hypothetical protein